MVRRWRGGTDLIMRVICEKSAIARFAVWLARNQSMISREIVRNGGRQEYRVHAAKARYAPWKSRLDAPKQARAAHAG